MTNLEDLPPSCKLVVKTLETADSPLTHSELRDASRLGDRTTRWARTRLENAGVVESCPSVADARQTCYSLAEEVEIIAT